ncbi:hypothetical protein RIF29_47449 [Crotalaria pallida]|uniref:Uncharacterized protein n=1 Tax=Crotalaria pallida TaxID=3830 RepID=A0AAN9DSV4_CROPI
MLSAVIRSALGYPAFTVGTITGTPGVRPSRSSRTRESPTLGTYYSPRWRRADIEVPNLPVDVSSWGRSASPFCPCTRGPISVWPEETFARLRYLLGGLRPIETVYLKLSLGPCRVLWSVRDPLDAEGLGHPGLEPETSPVNHAPPVSAFPKAPLSFKRIRGMSSPGGILNALATALHGSIRTTPSIHRLRLGLLGYLIPFAPLAFVSQCQCRPSRVLSPLVFFPISTHFTAPPEIPSAPTVLQLDALRPIIPDNACILCLTAAAGTELADAYSPDTVIASSPGKEESGPCLSPSVADHPLGPATDHRLGHRKDLEDPPKHESRDLS